MRMVPACLRTLAAGVVLAWAASPAVLSAAPAGAENNDKTVNSNEKLHADLDKVISIDIQNQPLDLAVTMLGDKSKINFVLDALTITQQLGFQPNMPPVQVNLNLKDVKVREVLRKIVGTYGLSYAVIGNTVLITTEDVATMRQMRQRINVDVSKVELADALKQLAKDSAVNLVLDSRRNKEASAKVSLQLEDVPLDTAVRLLSEMASLKTVRVGNTLFVTSKEIAADMRADPDLTQIGQPGQPPNPPPGFLAPPGVPIAPPTVIGAPPTTPTVPPAVDPDKPSDTVKPDEKKPDPDKKDPEKTSPKDGDK